MAYISFTVTLLKSFEVDSSHMPLSSEVKSSRMWSSRQWSTSDHFSLKLGHISVPQRLSGLYMAVVLTFTDNNDVYQSSVNDPTSTNMTTSHTDNQTFNQLLLLNMSLTTTTATASLLIIQLQYRTHTLHKAIPECQSFPDQLLDSVKVGWKLACQKHHYHLQLLVASEETRL